MKYDHIIYESLEQTFEISTEQLAWPAIASHYKVRFVMG